MPCMPYMSAMPVCMQTMRARRRACACGSKAHAAASPARQSGPPQCRPKVVLPESANGENAPWRTQPSRPPPFWDPASPIQPTHPFPLLFPGDSAVPQDGLKSCKYVRMTAIQRAALPHAIAGRDVLGAAKTGSGKTLAFLVPLVEKLYRMRWTRRDGLGALVLTPTRELALQIFEELKKVGDGTWRGLRRGKQIFEEFKRLGAGGRRWRWVKTHEHNYPGVKSHECSSPGVIGDCRSVGQHHDMSAGLLIGGKDVKAEQASVGSMNILVATPGRLLQHMDETPGFDAANLQMLVRLAQMRCGQGVGTMCIALFHIPMRPSSQTWVGKEWRRQVCGGGYLGKGGPRVGQAWAKGVGMGGQRVEEANGRGCASVHPPRTSVHPQLFHHSQLLPWGLPLLRSSSTPVSSFEVSVFFGLPLLVPSGLPPIGSSSASPSPQKSCQPWHA
eukprot:355556-Chlamydomonas_euryale.AAC.8